MEFKAGQTIDMPMSGHPRWMQNQRVVVHAVGPNGLLHLRIPGERCMQYWTMSGREMRERLGAALYISGPNINGESHIKPVRVVTVQVPEDATVEAITALLATDDDGRKRERRKVARGDIGRRASRKYRRSRRSEAA